MTTEFHYQIPWRSQSHHPGHHVGALPGGGVEYQGSLPFSSQPDARRLDVRAMLADPFGQFKVKSYRQRAAIPIYLLADVSTSMGFRAKFARLAEFCEALAWSAWRTGDPFGCFACDAQIHWEISLPLRWHKGIAAEWQADFAQYQPSSGAHQGLLEAASNIGRQRALVFLLSDFHLQDTELDALFNALALHDVIPVVLWDSTEYEHLPSFGLAELLDPETGHRRRLFLRPSLREKIAASFDRRREHLMSLCSAHGRAPFFMTGRFDPDAMTEYFYQNA
jgi:uncharacterized protein (DUF58 family)